MTDLAHLQAELLPGARLLTGGVGSEAGRSIGWVRLMRARVPAFEALEPGDLAIVPAAALAIVAPAGPERDLLIDAFRLAPVSGVVLLDGERSAGEADGPLGELADAAVSAGIPTLRLRHADPAGLERSIIGFIVARGAELERQAGLLEAELERRALDGGGAPSLVAAIATFLGRAVALETARGGPVAVHAPADSLEAASTASRYQARPRQAAALRFPLPTASGPAGSLVLLGDAPLGELGRATVDRITGLLALELARDEAVRRAGDHARQAEALPGAGPPWIVLLARQRETGRDDDTPTAREGREATRREVRVLAPARRLALRGDADSLEIRIVLALERAAKQSAGDVASPADLEPESGQDRAEDPAEDSLVRRIATLLGRTLAISRPFATRADRPAAEADARATLEAALALDDPPRVARAAKLPIYRMLGAVHNLPDGRQLARSLLVPILSGSPAARRRRLETLRAVLDHGGINEAAAALRVHRNTVAYRVRRIEAETGWRLSDPELRLPLAVAVRLVQEEQMS